MAIQKKKGTKGLVNKYISWSKALRQLQLHPRQFRRLCILKGIYPREPESRKKAQKGDTRIKTLYLRSDIRFLLHEKNIWKIRDEKIAKRKLKSFQEKKEKEKLAYLDNHFPLLNIDHIVLERYPKFSLALKDLDDALTTCFLHSAFFASNRRTDTETIQLCRKLTTEFMSYVIEARALRKSFVTFKGYYFRANIQGIDITWIVPHPFPVEVPRGIEFDTVKYSLEFYMKMLSFVNFKLFQSLNLHYPLRAKEKMEGIKRQSRVNPEVKFDYISSLNVPLKKLGATIQEEDEENAEKYDPELMEGAGLNLNEFQRKEILIKAQKKLFAGCKFFLGRETNRESLTFVIRSAGGEVSWDSSIGPGSTYQEDDINITHQIIDRSSYEKTSLRRYYLQPQWVYDSFNFAIQLPVQEYFVGTDLPPHLSPFEETYDGAYTPPELTKIMALQRKLYFKDAEEFKDDDLKGGKIEVQESEDTDDEDEEDKISPKKRKHRRKKKEPLPAPKEVIPEESKTKEPYLEVPWAPPKVEVTNTKTEQVLEEHEEEEEVDHLKNMKVKKGKFVKKNIGQELKKIEDDQHLMATKLINKKQRRLYHSLLQKEKEVKKRSRELQSRRLLYEKALKQKKRLSKKS